MRYWKKPRARDFLLPALALWLGGCAAAADAPKLSIERARVLDAHTPMLALAVAFEPSARQQQALDHGVALHLGLRLDDADGRQDWTLALRYFPLTRRYQLHVPDGEDRSFAVRGYLLDALQQLRLPLDAGRCRSACRVTVYLDHARLPGALRLPALLRPGWRAPAVSVPVEAGA